MSKGRFIVICSSHSLGDNVFTSNFLKDPFLRQPPKLMGTLRLLVAIEDVLGSMAPQINAMMAKAIALESKSQGTSNILLEDPDIAAILQITKEKLSGQIMAGKTS